jgi:hypothetical protein
VAYHAKLLNIVKQRCLWWVGKVTVKLKVNDGSWLVIDYGGPHWTKLFTYQIWVLFGKCWFCSGIADFVCVKLAFDLWKLSFALKTQNVALEYASKQNKNKTQGKNENLVQTQTNIMFLTLTLGLILSRPKIEDVPVMPSLKNIYNFPTLTGGPWQSIHYFFVQFLSLMLWLNGVRSLNKGYWSTCASGNLHSSSPDTGFYSYPSKWDDSI